MAGPGAGGIQSHPRRWWALVVLCLALVVVSIQISILNTALPTMVRDLGATDSQLQWIVDSYTVVFAGLLLTGAALADRWGRKGVLLTGLVISGVTTVGAALADGAGSLITWRALMGVGAALIMPATLSILVDVFREPGERRRAIAYWSLMNAVGAFVGPIAGGLLLKWFSWAACFWVNIPVIVVTVALGMWLVPTSRDPQAARFDLLGALLSTVALGALVWAIIEGPGWGWTSPGILAAFGVGALSGVLFVLWERHTPTPMLDLSSLRSPQLSAAALTLTVAFIAMTGSMYLAALTLQLVKGYSPLAAALATSGPIVVVNMIVVPRAPALIARFGLRRMVAFGTGTIAAAALVIATTTVDSPYWRLGLGFALMALAFSVFVPASTEAMMTSVPPERSGGASALNQLTRQVGVALGVALLGGIATAGFQARFDPGEVLDPEQAQAAGASLSAAVRVADGLSGSAQEAVTAAAGQSWLFGFRVALVVAAVLALAAALIAALAIPSQITHHGEPVAQDATAG